MQTAIFNKFAKKSDLRYLANMLKDKRYKNEFCIFQQKLKKIFMFFSNSTKKRGINIYVTL